MPCLLLGWIDSGFGHYFGGSCRLDSSLVGDERAKRTVQTATTPLIPRKSDVRVTTVTAMPQAPMWTKTLYRRAGSSAHLPQTIKFLRISFTIKWVVILSTIDRRTKLELYRDFMANENPVLVIFRV